MKRCFEDKLIIDGISYEDQGEYVNLIAARPNKVQSGPIKMEVRGRKKKTLCSNDSNSEFRPEIEIIHFYYLNIIVSNYELL